MRIETPTVRGFEVVDVAMPYAVDALLEEIAADDDDVVTRTIPGTKLVAIYARSGATARHARNAVLTIADCEGVPYVDPAIEEEV